MSDIDVVREMYEAMATANRTAAHADRRVVRRHPGSCAAVGRAPRRPRGFATFAATLTGTIDVGRHDRGDVRRRRRGHPGRPHRGTVVATGAPFDIPEVHRWTIRDGRAVAAHFAIDTAAMLAVLAAGER